MDADLVTPEPAPQILNQLMAVIQDRKANPPERSYTTTLFTGGVDRIGEKVIEEAAEVVDAAQQSTKEHLVHETADLLYHMMVMLVFKDIVWADVENELASRFGICGLDEKDARSP